MARSSKITDQNYYSEWESSGMQPGSEDLGYYQRANLEDIINNFIISHIGEDKVLKKVPRHEVAYWAQRAVQEFSYDTFHAKKSIEIEVSSSLSIALPNDYVNYTDLARLDVQGRSIKMVEDRHVRPSTTLVQDEDFNFMYDENGEIIKGEKPIAIRRFQEGEAPLSDDIRDYYYSEDSPLQSGYTGRRYGSDPRDLNRAPSFVIDLDDGVIYLDSSFQEGDFIMLQYISDGLGDNGDLSQVFVPKLAEDAIYADILYNLSKVRVSAVQMAPLYKKEAKAKMRNAKIRLTNYRSEEMIRVFRAKSKWIKH